MPTILRVKFRRDAHEHENGRLVPAYHEEVDLDALTPRARAFTEALHDATSHAVPGGTMLVQFECDLTNAELADLHCLPDAYRPVRNADRRAIRTVRWEILPSVSVVPLTGWLEDQARVQEPHWYPIGVLGLPRVPSWQAGAADRYVTRDQAMDLLRKYGAGLSLTGWQTLQRTDLMRPDRYAAGRPQWRPESVRAFAQRKRTLWPVSHITGLLGLSSADATGGQLRRWGIPAEGRQPGRTGENLYPADLVEAARATRPGRGNHRGSRDTPHA
ncbi:hypothetical protein [Actinacidiphila sp. ITFR-21]|uniref:hypothetical protein n=1 Tax=Actinacidiphila sp. ITFR-21 TaxID=3075199 RepID=UPI00288AAE06|nr:hypothetical protein [Streptomyces sp. ITFR-21]WNI19233.1 hypothetical protein RLT57_29260 [Streptomyces sp. ITFR-21]WNI19921.1 hypothetical protein RLT57_30725 [Streptomyces sp. ITFR-21]